MGMVHLQRKTWLIAGGQKERKARLFHSPKKWILLLPKILFSVIKQTTVYWISGPGFGISRLPSLSCHCRCQCFNCSESCWFLWTSRYHFGWRWYWSTCPSTVTFQTIRPPALFCICPKKEQQAACLGYQSDKKRLGHVLLQAHTFSACNSGLWYNFKVVWNWQRCHCKKVQNKCSFATGSWCFQFGLIHSKWHWICWWKSIGGYLQWKEGGDIEYPSLDSLLWKSHQEPYPSWTKKSSPTSSAAKYHSHRVFLQICQWKSYECNLPPEL